MFGDTTSTLELPCVGRAVVGLRSHGGGLADDIEEVEAIPVSVPTGQRRPAADLHRMIRRLDHCIPSLLRAIANLDPVVRVEAFLQLFARRPQEDTRRVHE